MGSEQTRTLRPDVGCRRDDVPRKLTLQVEVALLLVRSPEILVEAGGRRRYYESEPAAVFSSARGIERKVRRGSIRIAEIDVEHADINDERLNEGEAV